MEAYSKDTYFMNILKQVEAETRILQSKEHIQHGTTTVYEHCVQVAYESYLFAKEHQLQVEMEQLIRGALLHDYFLYDWHNQLTPHHLHGFFHPGVALRNASMDVELTPIEHDIIKKHMFPLTLVPARNTWKAGLSAGLIRNVLPERPYSADAGRKYVSTGKRIYGHMRKCVPAFSGSR